MNTTARIRSLTKIYIWLIILAVASSSFFEFMLPADLQTYIAKTANEEFAFAETVLIWVGTLLILAHFWSLYGLITVKYWAKSLFIFSSVALYSVALFMGPIVDNAIAGTIGGVGGLVEGMIIALLLFTQSEFNGDTSSLASGNIVDA